MPERLWTISNCLSILRLLLVVPIVYFLETEMSCNCYALALIAVAILTDLFDGIIARKLNQVTEFGKIIDPLADKIAVMIVAFVLVQQGKIPLWFFFAAAARDILILLGGMYVKKRKGIVLQSNLIGKWAVTVISVYILIVIANIEALTWLNDGLLVLSTAMLAVSFIAYTKRYFEVMKLATGEPPR
jgi:CDP-diacylglycerol--glycerol-3-phosphate 3-phosphatidyltransferase